MPIVYIVTSLTCRDYRSDSRTWCFSCRDGDGTCWDQVERMALHPGIPIHPTTDTPPRKVPFRVVYREVRSPYSYWAYSCVTAKPHRGEVFVAGGPVAFRGDIEDALAWLLEGEGA